MFVCSPLFSESVLYREKTAMIVPTTFDSLRVEWVESCGGLLSIAFDDTRANEISGESSSSGRKGRALAEDIGPILEKNPLRLLGQATPFQMRVWQAARRIPAGQTASYGELARRLGQPGASRAVGSALASNPYALLVPCHRIRPSDGSVGQYRWGSERKAKLLAAETTGSSAWDIVLADIRESLLLSPIVEVALN